MMNSVLLDTTYLISLVDDTRANHQQAKDFFKYFVENKYAMILSSIATCEFCARQPLTDLPLSNFKLLPFNISDSHHLRTLFVEYVTHRITGENRVSVKDDFKLISQASYNQIDYLITEDFNFFNRMLDLNSKTVLRTKPLFCPNGVHKEFKIPMPALSLFGETLNKVDEQH